MTASRQSIEVYSIEDFPQAIMLNSQDKQVIDSFYEHKACLGENLATTGYLLKRMGDNSKVIANWNTGCHSVTIQFQLDDSYDEAVLWYLKKIIPKYMFDSETYDQFYRSYNES